MGYKLRARAQIADAGGLLGGRSAVFGGCSAVVRLVFGGCSFGVRGHLPIVARPPTHPVPHRSIAPISGVVWLASGRDYSESGCRSGVQRMERFTSVYAGYDCGASLCPGYSRRRVDGSRYRDHPAP